MILPFLFVLNLFESTEGTHGMQKRGVARKNVGGYVDPTDVGPLILPILVHKGILLQHPLHVFLIVTALRPLVECIQKALYRVTNRTWYGLQQVVLSVPSAFQMRTQQYNQR